MTTTLAGLTTKSNLMVSKVLVDGDLIVYRAAWATEKTKYLVTDGEGVGAMRECDTAKEAKQHALDTDYIWHRKELKEEHEALNLVDTIMRDIRARYDDGTLQVYLTTEMPTFRDFIAKRRRYKAGRGVKPTHYGAIREHLINEWSAVVTEGEEADDAIGIAADLDSVIVSFDKDLDQIPGLHYDWTEKEEYEVSKKDATIFFYSQILSGDATDNVPGLEGIGEKKAQFILHNVKSPKEAWDRVLEKYIQHYGDDGPLFAMETARLVYVRRRAGEMWTPPV